ncbi:MAG: 50S ribosomal protein L10 [Candidatus Omnitrophica bacterium]|nr:50S ribosomal protein L10 [Candidatus Omnitrophota bacterium]
MANVGQFVKESVVEEMTTQLSQRPNVFVTSLKSLSAPEADTLRQRLSTTQSRLLVIKRSLGHRAVQRLQLPGLAELLEGSVGFVLSGADVLQTAKLLVEFRKTHEEQVALRGAIIEGQLLDAPRVEALAQLPPKPILLAQVVATVEAPIANLIGTIEQVIGDVMDAVEQRTQQRQQEPPPASSAAVIPAPPTPTSGSSTEQAPPSAGPV